MGFNEIFRAENWGMPFHFWSAVFFVFGCVAGSFLNVIIHRLPLEQSIVSPPSHCPHCKYSIPFYLNIPLVTWLWLRGKCANCGAPISIRYFLVELLTGVMFLLSWLAFGHNSVLVVLVYCLFISGLIAGTFIDFEHFIIPDEITMGGIVVGFLCSFLVPQLHGPVSPVQSVTESIEGIVIGAALFYAILRLGKLFFGRQKLVLDADTRVIFTETSLVLPDEEILYDELFYRKSDVVKLAATKAELCDRCYRDVAVKLTPSRLRVGEEEMDPALVPYLEVRTDSVTVPREAMGLGDVKLMAAIGAFLGWEAVFFTLMASSVIGCLGFLVMYVLKKPIHAGRLAFVPYLGIAAVVWIFGGHAWWMKLWMER